LPQPDSAYDASPVKVGAAISLVWAPKDEQRLTA
jgi:hypothetical protein